MPCEQIINPKYGGVIMAYRWLMRPQGLAFVLLALVLIMAVACGTSATDPGSAIQPTTGAAKTEVTQSTAIPEATTAPVVTGKMTPRGTLTYAYKNLPPMNVFPTVTEGGAYGWIGRFSGETLTFMNPQKEIIPNLIKEWSVAPDGVTWTFRLQEGVQFHQGYGDMTAEGVIWSIKMSGGESSRVAYNSHIRRLWGIGGDIAKGSTVTGEIDEGRTKALDRYTIEVNTITPQYDTLSVLAFPHINIFSRAQVEDVGVLVASKTLALTGPWEYLDAEQDQFTKFKAVENHWRKTPAFAELVMRHIPEESTRIANFQTGKLTTMQMDLDSIPAVEKVENSSLFRVPGGTAISLSFYGNYYTGLGTPEHAERVPGWDPSLPWISGNADPESEEWKTAAKIRTALSIAIDRQLLTDTLLRGEAVPDPLPAWGFHLDKLPPELRQWEYNPEKATRLLAEAGYADGFSIDLTPIGGYSYPEVTAAIAQMWEVVGVSAVQQNMPYATFRPGIVTRTYNQAYQHSHVAADPLDRWAVAFNSTTAWNFGVDHPILEELLAEAQGKVDDAERYAVMVEAARFLYENALAVGLYAQNIVYPLSSDTASWYEHLNFAETRDLTMYEWAPNLAQ
jgi:ABC-type transport system substrate-binding protein